jgi:hypothetical protein
MGHILPTDAITRGEGGAVLGMPWEMWVRRPMRAWEFFKDDQKLMAAGELVPNFVKNPIHAYGWATSGVKSTGRQFMTPDELGSTEAAAKAFGFQPASVARKREAEWSARRAASDMRTLQSRYYTRMARAIAGNEWQEADAIQREIDAHNTRHPVHQWIILHPPSLRQAVTQELRGVSARDRRMPVKARDRAEEIRQSRP